MVILNIPAGAPSIYRTQGNVQVDNMTKRAIFIAAALLLGGLLSVEDDSNLSGRLFKDVEALIDKGSYELMLEAKDDGETVRIFSSSNKDGDITEMLLTTKDADESTFICFTGLMSREDLEKLIADAGKER